jgi:SAM-dependent MidA family methyltransferase
LRFDAFMELALYGEPDGFYGSGRGAGRRTGDFLTSVEVGPLFGRLVARLADRCWDELGRPDEFTLVDAGAGRGTLARSVLAARPACAAAGVLRYVLVERSAALRREHEQLLQRPPGPCVSLESRADLPDEPFEGLVFANELLDNLPCRLLERTDSGWAEMYVAAGLPGLPVGMSAPGEGGTGGARPSAPTPPVEAPRPTRPVRPGSGELGRLAADEAEAPRPVRPAVRPPGPPGGLVESLVPAPAGLAARAAALAPDAPVGGRIPLATAALDWVGRALAVLRSGRLVTFDYTAATAELAARLPAEWLRTYRNGVRGHDPLVEPGSVDITCEVPLDQITAAHPGAEVCRQDDFLRALGIDDLVAEGRAAWHERAALGDLAALEARSRMHEGEALCDPGGLGAFTVATWHR